MPPDVSAIWFLRIGAVGAVARASHHGPPLGALALCGPSERLSRDRVGARSGRAAAPDGTAPATACSRLRARPPQRRRRSRVRKASRVGARRAPCFRRLTVFVPHPPGDPESAEATSRESQAGHSSAHSPASCVEATPATLARALQLAPARSPRPRRRPGLRPQPSRPIAARSRSRLSNAGATVNTR